jgi:L-threonylcarbamoyladenylate synthase
VSLTIFDACKLLKQGDVVVMPTETVYGLAADSRRDDAVAKIYALKNRPQFNPLIVHVSNLEMAKRFGVFNDLAYKLAYHFWVENPRPLTLVVAKHQASELSLLATAGLQTVAIRMPNHSKALELIDQCQFALVAPSANRSNHISPTSSMAVRQSLGDIPIVEGGFCAVGLESSILDLSGDQPILLRPGGLAVEDIEQYIGSKVVIHLTGDFIKAPGMMKRHYAPSIPLRMNAVHAEPGEAFLGFGPVSPSFATLNLSPQGNLNEAAANLFSMLNALDQGQFSGIAVAKIPDHGLGLAINDRLERASAQFHA